MDVEGKKYSKSDDESGRFFANLPAPWIDGKEKSKDYWKRHTNVLIVLVVYFVAVIAVYITMFVRYRTTDVFWTALFVTFVWAFLGAICTWYVNIHFDDLFVAIMVAVGFVAVQAGLIIMILETQHQRIVYIPLKKPNQTQ